MTGGDDRERPIETPEALPADCVVAFATMDDVDAIADQWVDLAAGQRRHGSHLRADANRGRVRELVHGHVASDTALVARRDADAASPAIVGFLTFGRETETFAQDVARGIVHNVYVAPGHRGEGIGSALLATAEALLADRGVDRVALEVMAGNADARRFYRRHGYRPHRVELETDLTRPETGSDSLTTDDG